jgi:hypothetical protein
MQFAELDRQIAERDRLNIEWNRLQLEQGTYTTPGFVEQVAINKLHMAAPVPAAAALTVTDRQSDRRGGERDPLGLSLCRLRQLGLRLSGSGPGGYKRPCPRLAPAQSAVPVAIPGHRSQTATRAATKGTEEVRCWLVEQDEGSVLKHGTR